MLLSICIGTYNRISQLLATVQEILRCPSPDFEVVVLDNVSPDGTFEKLLALSQKDSRLRVLQNEHNIGGVKNPCKALTLGKGTYVLLLLDKDRIDSTYLSDFLDFLKTHEIDIGICALDENEYGKPSVICDNRIDSLLSTSYMSKHLSGNFYRHEMYCAASIVQEILNTNIQFTFCCELINAEIAAKSKLPAVVYKQPLVHMYTPEEFSSQPTLTFTKDEDLYILPKNRRKEYLAYVVQTDSFNLPSDERKKAYEAIIQRFKIWLKADVLYFDDPSVCSHYRISEKQKKAGKSLFVQRVNIVLFYVCFLCSRHGFFRLNYLLGRFFTKVQKKLNLHTAEK